MNALTRIKELTLTSREMAELVELRHDNVKRTIETLIEKGVIVRPQIEDEQETDKMGRPRTISVYVFSGEKGKRDSIVVVAQLSPEFTARLVDRWQELENKVQPVNVIRSSSNTDKFKRALKLTPLAVKALRALGCDKNSAAIGANQLIRKQTQVDLLTLSGNTHLVAENQTSGYYTPTELGQQLNGLSAQKVNKLLEASGLQKKIAGYWQPTKTGTQYARLLDTQKQHSNGTLIQQIKWADSVVPILQAA